MTALDRIAARGAERSPHKVAIAVPGGRALTYAELDRAVSAFAASLRERGASAGDCLVLAGANTPEFFVGLFAAARAGLTAIPLDHGLAQAELHNLLQHARPFAVVADERSSGAFDVPLLRVGDAPESAAPLPDGGRPGEAQEAQEERRPAFILYTSGTTGRPRGAVHSHAGVLQKLSDLRSWFDLGESDTALCLLPTHFGHGLVCVCLAALDRGATLVLSRPFDLTLMPRVFALADEYQVTTFSTVPTIIRLLLRNDAVKGPTPGKSRLRFVTCASAPLHPEEGEAFEARFGVPLLNCYGITEGGTWSALSPDDPARDRRSVGTQVGCRFRAIARDVDDVRPLPAGEIGELQIAGPSLMLGYHGDPEATAAVLRDGWLSTGDLGSVDESGRVYLAGRSKDLIIRAGANIYPAEIEGVLLRHPDVAEAYVVGLDHPVLGEQVAACVVRAGGQVSEKELIGHCRAVLAAYKCPESVRFVDSVPKTSRGKVTRASIKTLLTPI